jgi:cobalt-precorrin-5B (C1)-methyltransferase
MWPESAEQPKALRTGLTTGCCATACTVAAAQVLLTNTQPKVVSVTLPKGKIVELDIDSLHIQNNRVIASTIKDAGDDPDVTHGARVFVELSLITEPSIEFVAGKGVGTVTREGLLLEVGEPAINPVPRKMITEHLQHIAKEQNYTQGFKVTVGVEEGESLALKTMNPRLGIVGGLSILGTTGIVRPFSCSAYIASIHQGIDVAKANGFTHITASTGNASETAIATHYQLPEMAQIEMGDFVGAVLKYFKKVPLNKLSICGGFGKMTKLANGHLDLHSQASSIDFEQLASLAAKKGASEPLINKIKHCNTSVEALKYCQLENIDLASSVCEQALNVAAKIVPNSVELEVWAIDRLGNFVGSAKSATNTDS